jgi:hypothetical protein
MHPDRLTVGDKDAELTAYDLATSGPALRSAA